MFMIDTVDIPYGLNRQLFAYTDFTNGGLAFASNADDWRLLTGHKGTPVRVAVRGLEIPPLYKLNGNGLAFEGIVRL